MSSWKSLLLPIGDKGPKYSASSNVINCIETCFLMLRREFDQAEDEMLANSIEEEHKNLVEEMRLANEEHRTELEDAIGGADAMAVD